MRKLGIFIVLTYLKLLAKLAIKLHKPFIISIAGSQGKTSTRNALKAIIQDYYSVKAVGNSETGIPLGILGILPQNYNFSAWFKMLLAAPFGLNYLRNTKYLIIEMGIDDPYPPKNMSYLLTFIKPDIAISLNISVQNSTPSHAMQFEKLLRGNPILDKHEFLLTQMAKEDTKVITQSGCKIGIYNIDDLYIQNLLIQFEKTHKETQLLSFGKSRVNKLSYLKHEISLSGTIFEFNLKEPGSKSQKLLLNFKHLLLPKVYQEVFAASILAATCINISPEQIISSLQKNYVSPKGRSSMFMGINNSVIIDSSYNASRASVVAFLEMVFQLKKQTKRDVVMLFGDMRELGSESESEHKAVARHMIGIVDYIYLVGKDTKEYILPMLDETKVKGFKWFESSYDAGIYLKANLPKRSIVLVKGSQNTIYLEEAIKFIIKNKDDESKLCRQSEYWLGIKNIKLFWQNSHLLPN